jgi:hypothetical protein
MTFTLTIVFKNRGPWNNPMLFFLIHFLTSWSLVLWSEPFSLDNKPYPVITFTAISILIAVLLAATKTLEGGVEKFRRVKDNHIVQVVTQTKNKQIRLMPNRYFWGLVIFESCLIIAAYLLEYVW